MSDDRLTGIHSVTILRCAEGDRSRLEDVMVADYEYLSGNPAFLEGRLVASRAAPGTYFHVTHWASAEALQAAAQDPEVKRILGELPLAQPLEPHPGDVVVSAAGGRVHKG